MQQKPQKDRLILFHDPVQNTWTEDTPLNLFAFATHDAELTAIVRALKQDPTGQVVENQKIVARIMLLIEQAHKSIDSFYLSPDIEYIVDTVTADIDRDQDSNICFHIIPTDKTLADLMLKGTSSFGFFATSALIKNTLRECTTQFMSHAAQQMKLAELFIRSAAKHCAEFQFKKSYSLICHGRKFITNNEVKIFYAQKSAKLLVNLSMQLLIIAKEKPDPAYISIAILNQAMKYGETALLYFHDCPDKEEMASGLKVIVELYELLIAKALPYSRNTLQTYQLNPDTVADYELQICLDSLEKILARTVRDNKIMLKTCYFDLVAIHNALAERTNDPTKAQDHLTQAIKFIQLIDFGVTPRSKDLVAAGISNMQGKIHLKQNEPTLAVGFFKKAKQAYSRHHLNDASACMDRLISIHSKKAPKML